MVDAAQIALLAVVVALTVLLVFLGIQIFFTLLEFRKTLKKANRVLDDLGIVSGAISSPISALSSLASMVELFRKNNFLSTIIAALSAVFLTAKKDKKLPIFEKKQEKTYEKKEKEVESTNGELKKVGEEEKPRARRFFKGIPKRYY